MALIMWENVGYVAEGSEDEVAAPNEYVYHAGQYSYSFENVLAAFTEMPDEIQFVTSGSHEYRAHLANLGDADPSFVVSTLIDGGHSETALAFTKLGLDSDPHDETLLHLALRLAEPNESIDFLETRLDERPILVDWHRAYQGLVEDVRPDRDLESEYRRLVEAEPQNKNLQYLLGRVTSDRSQALRQYGAASSGSNPSAYAFHALAYDALIRGRFDRALEFERKAVETNPNKGLFMAFERDALLASGRIEELIERDESALRADGATSALAVSLLKLYGIRGDTAKAAEFVSEYLAQPEEYDDESTRSWAAGLLSSYPEGAQEADEYARLAMLAGGPEWLFRAAAAKGELHEAMRILDEDPPEVGDPNLLLYAMASHQGDVEAANNRLGLSLQAMEGNWAERMGRAFLVEGAKMPSVEEVYDSSSSNDLPLRFLALGYRHPENRDVYFAAARRLAYDPTFPGFVVSEILEAEGYR